jgi:hypothetical protein
MYILLMQRTANAWRRSPIMIRESDASQIARAVAMFRFSRPNSRVGTLSRREVPILQDVRWLALIVRWVFQEKFLSDFLVRQPASGLNYR